MKFIVLTLIAIFSLHSINAAPLDDVEYEDGSGSGFSGLEPIVPYEVTSEEQQERNLNVLYISMPEGVTEDEEMKVKDSAEFTTDNDEAEAESTTEFSAVHSEFNELKRNFSDKVIDIFTITQGAIGSVKAQKGDMIRDVNLKIDLLKSNRKHQLDRLDMKLKEKKAELNQKQEIMTDIIDAARSASFLLEETAGLEKEMIGGEIEELSHREFETFRELKRNWRNISELKEKLRLRSEQVASEIKENDEIIEKYESDWRASMIAYEAQVEGINEEKLKILSNDQLENLLELKSEILNDFYLNKSSRVYDYSFDVLRQRVLEDFDNDDATTTTTTTSTTERVRIERSDQWAPHLSSLGLNELPEHAVSAGNDYDNTALYVIRGLNSLDKMIVGKYSASRKEAYVSNGMLENKINHFEILTASKYSWVSAEASVDSFTVGDSDVVICRVRSVIVLGDEAHVAWTPGFVTDEGKCMYTHGGVTDSRSNYEMLMIEE